MTTFKKTPFDLISKKVAPVLRNLQDIYINRLTGTQTNLLRITESEIDLSGDSTYSLSQSLISNAIIEYPFSDIEIFAKKDQTSTLPINAISIFDLLPVKILIPHSSSSFQNEASNMDENDLLVDIIFSQDGDKIPVILQSPVIRGTFLGKELIQKTYNATLFRGTLEPAIKNIVDNYVSYLGVPSILSTIPVSGTSGVARDTNITIQFTVPMNSGSVENNFTITPSCSHVKTWDTVSGIVLTVNPVSSLSGLTTYTFVVSSSVQSTLNVPAEEVQSFYFTTA